jgi:hypothetical protein
MARGNLYMAHRCGFTQKVLAATLAQAGFASVASARRQHPFYDLWALAAKAKLEETAVKEMAGRHFPG